ncbi:histidine ammonia-lyase [Taibaiella chishuiensis]|uniref:Histidine ammonia-lyase n=1 Tax=Taibaiella chishuiensis TaxID=1434707 RepID=A0A2P8D9R1_9BACT|nr:histidine ammonia-lyase [Taibaiella chishuiensis]PSK93927.1 histidine ammonia-lyase [Taibaiella chishuiensis]
MELPAHLSIAQLTELLNNKITLSATDLQKVNANRDFLDRKIAGGDTYYGINTGFGSLCDVRISDDQLKELQENLVCSHACGFGDEVPSGIVKLMLLLKIRGLAQGFSGIHEDTIQRLVAFYNEDLLPVVFEQGSLGASGDLAPLAHLSLPLLGKGKVRYNNEVLAAADALQQKGMAPLPLHAKEGLALLNGTQFMSSYATWALLQAQRLQRWADVIAALSLEAFDGKAEPFSHPIHRIRPHAGQIETAEAVRSLLEGSELQQGVKIQVQDPYSFRCVPQVHGATKDVIRNITAVVEIEINSVTDNPIVFEEEDLIQSGGNFHGQPLALNLDFFAIAMAELANISERRTYLLVSGQRGLPPFLAKNAGLHSGFMIAQYTAASIVSQNKQYCTPASVDSIVSSNGQEDHVSMGANAATKLKKVIDNVQRVLAIELLCAAQALDFRQPAKTSPKLQRLFEAFRKEVTFNDADRILHDDMARAERFLDQQADAILG